MVSSFTSLIGLKNLPADHAGCTKDVTPKLLNSTDYMNKVSSLYAHTEKMAVWPFDTSLISQFAISVVLPIILIAVQLYFEIFAFNLP